MARKKIVFIIVEGASDETALGVAMDQVFDKDTVHVHIMHGDITTRTGVNTHNIISQIGNEINKYAKNNFFKSTDFKQIIHIVDTDAAYLSDERIIEDLQCDKLSYQDDGIHTDDVTKVILRNQQKRDNLSRLRGNKSIKGIPYSVYYMSCNLDHVLHGKRNSTDEEKENDAYDFAKKCKDNDALFTDFICESPFSVEGNYQDTWNFIEQDMHSIERHTNLGICLKQEVSAQESINS